MFRCLLVASYEEPPRSFIKPPLGLMWLRKVAESAGLPVSIEIVDPQLVGVTRTKRMIEGEWDLIGFYTTYPTLLNSVELMTFAWATHADHPVARPFMIAGGPGAAFSEILSMAPLDMIAIGESEKLWVELLRRITGSGCRPPISSEQLPIFADLPGQYQVRYARAEDGEIEVLSRTSPLADSLLDAEAIDRFIAPRPWELGLHAPYVDWTRANLGHSYGFPLYATRGCSRPGCMFCSSFKSISSKGGTRAPTVESLLGAFQLACDEPLRVRSFILEDDTFVWNRAWVTDLCRLVRQAKDDGELPRDVTFVVKSRVDQFDDELIQVLMGAGFSQINVGMESGSPRTLRRIAKVADPVAYLEKADAVIRSIKTHGLRVHAYMLFFTPESELADLVATMELATDLISRGAEVSTYETVLALPGSPYEQVWRRGRAILESDRIDNPLLSVRHATPSGPQSFWTPSFGHLPRQVELPRYLLPSDPVMQAVLHGSRERFPRNWGDFKRRFGWRSSTSARDGYVRIWTYLDVLEGMRAAAPYADRLGRLRALLDQSTGWLGPEPGQLPENQSCSNYDLLPE
jgi:radical SAM superfamily enzyme YgiQ (UPF0313 family)